MAQNDSEPAKPGKGKAFFERADEVAETGNWDFAIEMYIEGIRREPTNVEQGYQPLREVSLKRKAQGGKGPGLRDKVKNRPGKDHVDNLAKACHLLAKEPGSVAFMEQVLKAALKLESEEVAKWICNIMLEAQRQADKPDRRILAVLAQTFDKVADYARGIAACEMILKLAPDDGQVLDALRELSAKQAIQGGKYEQQGDFTKGVADMEKQTELLEGDSMAQRHQFVEKEIERARAEYEQDPTVPGKVHAFVDALLKIEEEAYENEAINVLMKAFRDTKAYQHKMRVGDVKIRQMTRRYAKLKAAGDEAAARRQATEQLKFELAEYLDRTENYPTDLALKYELGRRQLIAKEYDEAIASLQQATRDPRRHVPAMNYLGQAFLGKGWLPEACETFERALKGDLTENRAKSLRYNLGDVLEKMEQFDRAQDEFSRVAQIDFNYRDVRDRLDNIRQRLDRDS